NTKAATRAQPDARPPAVTARAEYPETARSCRRLNGPAELGSRSSTTPPRRLRAGYRFPGRRLPSEVRHVLWATLMARAAATRTGMAGSVVAAPHRSGGTRSACHRPHCQGRGDRRTLTVDIIPHEHPPPLCRGYRRAAVNK